MFAPHSLPLTALLGAVAVWTFSTPAHANDPNGTHGIVNGDITETCGWPTTLATSGCTATLIHPRAISTAQHCGAPSSVHFGPTASGMGQDVGVVGCVGTGSDDAQICELAEEVTEVPVTPVTFGCELDELVQVGQAVVVAGFGETNFGMGDFGTKRWVEQTITAVEPGRVIIGNGGDPTSPCAGDSGGPVYVQGSDGGWRVIGTLLGGTTGIPCNSAAQYMRLDPVVAAFEMQHGIDITPCFDGQTGAWEATEDCGGFFSGDHTGEGTWADWCAGAPAAGYSDACGAPYADGGGETGSDETGGDGKDDDTTTGGEGDTGDGSAGQSSTPGGTTGGDSTTDDASGSDGGMASGDDDSSGCSCKTGTPTSGGVWLMALVFGAGWRRRRQ